MKAIGFSGARSLSKTARRAVAASLYGLDADTYITGAAVGVDSFVGRALITLFPAAAHRVIVPANRSQADLWWPFCDLPPRFDLTFMPAGSSYQQRNAEIVKASTELIAYPLLPEHDQRSWRSGTWQTVRLARKAGLSVRTHILSEFDSTWSPGSA